ncbi:MAG: NAD(P)H-dependent oxidoreductase subunit E [Pseudomonadota bacterium]
MNKDITAEINKICTAVENARVRMMDIVRAVQEKYGCVSDDAIEIIARNISIPRVEVESMVSFYAFLSKEQKGTVAIRLCNDIIDRIYGCDVVARAFTEELGIGFGETTTDGFITLEHTPCIGMCDQAPAALVNNVVVTDLSSDKVRKLVKTLRETRDPQQLVTRFGNGNNSSDLVKAMVTNNIRKKGGIIFPLMDSAFAENAGLERAIAMSPVEVIDEINTSRLRGRGGAGFPTGMKWEFTRSSEGANKYIICNADEGEPGTFKDRVILTELPDLLIEGMTIAAYAMGAENGILYLRGEYAYLYDFLMSILSQRREKKLLGNAVMGKKGFNFDIRIQMGAGAYVCGEETALIRSCEGMRGDPRNRPPFPAQKGYLESPTCVNNVETFCCAVRILDKGAAWFSEKGTKDSHGTKLLSISGNCQSPGIYEVPFGITVREMLREAGAANARAVQIGGPSGQMIGPADFDRRICFEELATGGSVMVFGPERDILEVVSCFVDFFIEESCGYCTPCRAGNVILKKYLQKIMSGTGEPADLAALQDLGAVIKTASRCGLGQTSPNPVLTTLKNFRSLYEARVTESKSGLQPSFDLAAALKETESIIGRASVHP